MDGDVRARREPTVLVRIAIDEVVEEVVPDPAIVSRVFALPGAP